MPQVASFVEAPLVKVVWENLARLFESTEKSSDRATDPGLC